MRRRRIARIGSVCIARAACARHVCAPLALASYASASTRVAADGLALCASPVRAQTPTGQFESVPKGEQRHADVAAFNHYVSVAPRMVAPELAQILRQQGFRGITCVITLLQPFEVMQFESQCRQVRRSYQPLRSCRHRRCALLVSTALARTHREGRGTCAP